MVLVALVGRIGVKKIHHLILVTENKDTTFFFSFFSQLKKKSQLCVSPPSGDIFIAQKPTQVTSSNLGYCAATGILFLRFFGFLEIGAQTFHHQSHSDNCPTNISRIIEEKRC